MDKLKGRSVEQFVNDCLAGLKAGGAIDTNEISDTYHTFGDLYKHRNTLFIAFCRMVAKWEFRDTTVWISRKNIDGSEWEGYFVMGISTQYKDINPHDHNLNVYGDFQPAAVTYHLPVEFWDVCKEFSAIVPKSLWDGKSKGDDVLKILLLTII